MSNQTVSFDPDAEEVLELMQKWHSSRIGTLQQILALKETDRLVLQGANGNEVELTGNARKGYIAGIHLAVELFTPFPLEIEPISSDEEE